MRPDEKPACVESLPSIPSLMGFRWLDQLQLWGKLVFPRSGVRTWNTWIFQLTHLRDSGDFSEAFLSSTFEPNQALLWNLESSGKCKNWIVIKEMQ